MFNPHSAIQRPSGHYHHGHAKNGRPQEQFIYVQFGKWDEARYRMEWHSFYQVVSRYYRCWFIECIHNNIRFASRMLPLLSSLLIDANACRRCDSSVPWSAHTGGINRLIKCFQFVQISLQMQSPTFAMFQDDEEEKTTSSKWKVLYDENLFTSQRQPIDNYVLQLKVERKEIERRKTYGRICIENAKEKEEKA